MTRQKRLSRKVLYELESYYPDLIKIRTNDISNTLYLVKSNGERISPQLSPGKLLHWIYKNILGQ